MNFDCAELSEESTGDWLQIDLTFQAYSVFGVNPVMVISLFVEDVSVHCEVPAGLYLIL